MIMSFVSYCPCTLPRPSGFKVGCSDASKTDFHGGAATISAGTGLAPARNAASKAKLVAAVGRLALRGGRHLAARVGIATGTVVVGATAGPAGASELSAVGDTPNLAARLQSLAEPNTVVIAASTHALTRGVFRYADLGRHRLKGIPDPVRVWQVVSEAAASRFEAAHATGLGRFVGREQEVALLYSRWEQAVGGEGQTVLLSGEAGIGKSRIAEQLRQRLHDHACIRYQCSPFHVSSALQPAIAQLRACRTARCGG